MKYLVLVREDLMDHVEERALRNKPLTVVCKFQLEHVICRQGKIVVDGGELNANESREFFDKLRVKFSLTNASNLEANGKIE